MSEPEIVADFLAIALAGRSARIAGKLGVSMTDPPIRHALPERQHYVDVPNYHGTQSAFAGEAGSIQSGPCQRYSKYSERSERMFQPLFDVCLKRSCCPFDITRERSIEHLAVLLHGFLAAVREDQHLVAQILVVKHGVQR